MTTVSNANVKAFPIVSSEKDTVSGIINNRRGYHTPEIWVLAYTVNDHVLRYPQCDDFNF
jgi:hypothetical protein